MQSVARKVDWASHLSSNYCTITIATKQHVNDHQLRRPIEVLRHSLIFPFLSSKCVYMCEAQKFSETVLRDAALLEPVNSTLKNGQHRISPLTLLSTNILNSFVKCWAETVSSRKIRKVGVFLIEDAECAIDMGVCTAGSSNRWAIKLTVIKPADCNLHGVT